MDVGGEGGRRRKEGGEGRKERGLRDLKQGPNLKGVGTYYRTFHASIGMTGHGDLLPRGVSWRNRLARSG